MNAPEAAFAAGAALFALDRIVRADPPWLGALRMRQALVAATASAGLLRLRKDEGALRDAHHLTRPGDDPGPAGRLHRAWRDLAQRPARLDAAPLHRLGRELGLEPSAALLDRSAAGQGDGNPVAVAAEAAAAAAASSSPQDAAAEVFGLMLADAALAARLGWPTPLPLLAWDAVRPAPRRATGRRPRPGDPDWSAMCHAAYARAAGEAHARAVELQRRADRLLALADRVRTRAGEAGVSALLADDAAAALTGLGSDRAARRFLVRLAALGAVRELTGRPTFSTRSRFADAIRAARGDGEESGAPTLTPTENLVVTAIAYLQPVTRAGLSRLLGREVGRDTIARLKRLDLVGAGPRMPQVGAPLTYVTTPAFLSLFGLGSLRDLPDLKALEDAGLLDQRPDEECGPGELDEVLGLHGGADDEEEAIA